MKQTVSILGCGWLGLPVALKLLHSGFRVSGSTTTPTKVNELRSLGVEPYLINLSDQRSSIDKNFLKAEVLIISIPFRRDFHNPFEYVDQLMSVIKDINDSPIRHVLFASSTSIYPDFMLDAREDIVFDPDNERSKALLQAENLFHGNQNFSTAVLRLSGLCGYDRQVGRFLSNKTGLKNGNAPVNLIHRDDCVEIIDLIVKGQNRNEIYNLCCDGHPTRKELYVKAAEDLGVPPPVFQDEAFKMGKVVNNQKIKNSLSYSFKYSHPFDFQN